MQLKFLDLFFAKLLGNKKQLELDIRKVTVVYFNLLVEWAHDSFRYLQNEPVPIQLAEKPGVLFFALSIKDVGII